MDPDRHNGLRKKTRGARCGPARIQGWKDHPQGFVLEDHGVKNRSKPMKLTVISAIAIFLTAMAGCTASTPVPAPTPTATTAACEPSPILTTENGFSEIRGNMHSDGELWALLFFGYANTGIELKIVWRITGDEGEFTVEARHEDGTIIAPAWGPEYHDW